MHWVNSILTYCDKSKTNKGVLYPRILFVATHKDTVVIYSFKNGGVEIFLIPIKIRFLTYFPLLICFHVGISEETSSRVICE